MITPKDIEDILLLLTNSTLSNRLPTSEQRQLHRLKAHIIALLQEDTAIEEAHAALYDNNPSLWRNTKHNR